MNINGIVVTGVGGGVGQSILKCLKESPYKVIGVDSLSDATGLFSVGRRYLGEFARSSKFIDRILEICKKESANVIFPGLDAELIPFAEHGDVFKREGIEVIVSSKDVIDIADDKLKTADFLNQHGFLYSKTGIELSEDLKFPVMVKPRKGGARSKDCIKCVDITQLQQTIEGKENFVIQEFVEGEEYTCGTLNYEGKCYGVIPMRRELRAGDTYKAYIKKDKNIMNYVQKVMDTLKPFGACNVQLIVKEGRCYIFEVNARCSGTTAARALAGFNEPRWICQLLEKGICAPLDFSEMVIYRYWKEMAIDYFEIDQIKESGFALGQERTL